MHNYAFLQKVYQQWCDGQDNYRLRWMDFVILATSITNSTTEEMIKILEKCRWFEK